jgi:hypothetical protein
MENQQQNLLVEVEYISIPVLVFHGEAENIPSKLVYSVDENGIRNLITTEEEAKGILYNSIIQTKEEQEILNRFKEEDSNHNSVIIELPNSEKDYLKNFEYGVTLEFIGYEAETNKPQFKIIRDTISGIPEQTVKLLNNSKIVKEQLQLF